VLGLLFVFLTARAVSLRRLGLLLVLVFVLSAALFDILRARHVLSDALITASALTLLVWTLPLARILRGGLRTRTPSLDELRHVSAFVQWTYGVALAATPILAVESLFGSARHLTLGMLTRLLLLAAVIGGVAPIAVMSMGQCRRTFDSRTRHPAASQGESLEYTSTGRGLRVRANERLISGSTSPLPTSRLQPSHFLIHGTSQNGSPFS
jgi:hypothetical protein